MVDIDLDKVQMSDEDLEKADKGIDHLQYKLKTPFVYHVRNDMEKRDFGDYDGKGYNFLEFRIPLLGDALRNEKNYKDSILFWRKIALDCLTRVCSWTRREKLLMNFLLRLLDSLDYLFLIILLMEKTLKEFGMFCGKNYLPFLSCMMNGVFPCNRITPVTIEPSSFFSD